MSDIRVQHSNWSSRIGTTIVVIAFMALAAAPWWAERANLRLLAEIYAYVALASLWNLLAGYAGLVSVGQQAYVGLGAYILFALAMLGGVHPLAAIPLAGVGCAIARRPLAQLAAIHDGGPFAGKSMAGSAAFGEDLFANGSVAFNLKGRAEFFDDGRAISIDFPEEFESGA